MVVASNPLINKSALKRSSIAVSQPCSVSFAPHKKLCLSPSISRRNSAAALYSFSSSEDDDDDSDNDTTYMNNQRRARKRAYSIKQRSASFADDRLSHAVSKYSDVDEDTDDDKQLKKSDSIQELKSLTKESEDTENKSHRGSMSNSGLFSNDSRTFAKKSVLDLDKVARNRCFDYLVGAIDEAWARYCDATSYAEDEAFKNEYLPNTPASLAMSEYEDDEEEQTENLDDSEKSFLAASRTPSVVEYSSDVELRRVSSHPGNLRLQQLKDRLLKAKYYLQDYLDTTDSEEAVTFWRRWDLIKYATIELVEDDDDDEIIESTTEDLEKGRLYGCY